MRRVLFGSEAIERITKKLKKLSHDASTAPDKAFISGLLREVTNDGLELPVMPKVVVDIQRVIDSPASDLDEIVEATEREPMVTTKLVGIASSAYYKMSTPPRGLRDAIFRIGMTETRNVVLAIVSQSRLFRVPGFEARATELHRRALASAVAARELARRMRADADEAFLAGMTHDIGSVVLSSSAAEIHRQSRGKSLVSPELLDTVDAELHAEVGALIAQTWDFPARLVSAFRGHHDPRLASDDAAELAELLLLADAIGRQLVTPAEQSDTLAMHPSFETLGLREPERVLHAIQLAFEQMVGGFDAPPPRPQPSTRPRASTR
ncbi:HDOD domain-containing protein [Myxococcota bacterium]|nr:HDOD domain-containing protein [Myxococcota bacterium]